MDKEFFKMLVKYPLSSIFILIGLTIPCSIELYTTNWHNISQQGFTMVMFISIIFSVIAILLWAVVYLLSIPISKALNPNDYLNKDWQTGIAASGFSFFLWGLICVVICYLNQFNFKTFLILCYSIPIYRIGLAVVQLFFIKIIKK